MFCWYELMAKDPAGAAAFYGEVLGWGAVDSGMPGVDYRLFIKDGAPQGGMMLTEDGGPPPGWGGYVAVADCDATVDAAKAAGASVHAGPQDIPGVGRFAALSDPQGAAFSILQPLPPSGDTPPPPQAAWHQLHAKDGEAAWSFYSDLFGWAERWTMDMGPGGQYRIFGEPGGDARGFGGMMTDGQAPRPYWHFFFPVTGTTAAMERVKAAGGTVFMGPQEVPGGEWVAMCADPAGAPFGLASRER